MSERGEASEMASDRIEALEADNARLRALIKQVEKVKEDDTGALFCPWCEVEDQARVGEHHASCAAFTVDGEVK